MANPNEPGISNRTAVIAGIAPGLGESLHDAFSNAGYGIVGLARSETMAERLRASSAYTHYRCDLTSGDDVQSIVDKIAQDHGSIDVLICNAHQLMIQSFADTSPADFESVWRNTCFSAVTAAHATIPHMEKQGYGTVILTGATAGTRGGGKFSAFASAKFALRGLAQSLAREYQPKGIHVAHTILDGLIWEEQTRDRFDPPEEKCMAPEAIARAYLQLVNQDPSTWTHELDLRPFGENF